MFSSLSNTYYFAVGCVLPKVGGTLHLFVFTVMLLKLDDFTY